MSQGDAYLSEGMADEYVYEEVDARDEYVDAPLDEYVDAPLEEHMMSRAQDSYVPRSPARSDAPSPWRGETPASAESRPESRFAAHYARARSTLTPPVPAPAPVDVPIEEFLLRPVTPSWIQEVADRCRSAASYTTPPPMARLDEDHGGRFEDDPTPTPPPLAMRDLDAWRRRIQVSSLSAGSSRAPTPAYGAAVLATGMARAPGEKPQKREVSPWRHGPPTRGLDARPASVPCDPHVLPREGRADGHLPAQDGISPEAPSPPSRSPSPGRKRALPPRPHTVEPGTPPSREGEVARPHSSLAVAATRSSGASGRHGTRPYLDLVPDPVMATDLLGFSERSQLSHLGPTLQEALAVSRPRSRASAAPPPARRSATPRQEAPARPHELLRSLGAQRAGAAAAPEKERVVNRGITQVLKTRPRVVRGPRGSTNGGGFGRGARELPFGPMNG